MDKSVAPSFNEKHAAGIRLWHWISFVLITGSLLTVLISTVLLKPRVSVPMIQQGLQSLSINLNNTDARKLVNPLNHRLWDIHKWFGIGLSVMLLFRIIVEFRLQSGQKMVNRIKNAVKFLKLAPASAADTRHYLLTKWLYIVFYSALLVMALTGLTIIDADDLGLKNYEENLKDVHSFFMYVILAFISIHLIGVIRAELGKHKGLVSRMINGGE